MSSGGSPEEPQQSTSEGNTESKSNSQTSTNNSIQQTPRDTIPFGKEAGFVHPIHRVSQSFSDSSEDGIIILKRLPKKVTLDAPKIDLGLDDPEEDNPFDAPLPNTVVVPNNKQGSSDEETACGCFG